MKTRLVGVRIPAGGVIWFATSLSATEASAAAVGRLYLSRWQLERMFKRFKSLGGLRRLKARKNGPPAKRGFTPNG